MAVKRELEKILGNVTNKKPTKSTKTTKKINKTIKKHTSKISKGVIFVLALLFVISAAAGFGVCWKLSENDLFVLVGNKEIVLEVGDIYVEAGAQAVSLGRDVTDKITLSGNVDVLTAGTYYIIYKVDCYKYKNYQIVRKVIVQEVAGDE